MELWKLLIATWIFVLIGCESIYLIMVHTECSKTLTFILEELQQMKEDIESLKGTYNGDDGK